MTYLTFYRTKACCFDSTFDKSVLLTNFEAGAVTDVHVKLEGLRLSNDNAALKAHFAVINDSFNEGCISLREKDRGLREDWIPSTKMYADDWGLHMVLYDLHN